MNESNDSCFGAELTLTYSKAVEMALGMEAAAKNSQMLLGHKAVEEVNRVHQTSEVHRNCGKQGHIVKICRAAPKVRLMNLPQGRSSIKTVQ